MSERRAIRVENIGRGRHWTALIRHSPEVPNTFRRDRLGATWRNRFFCLMWSNR